MVSQNVFTFIPLCLTSHHVLHKPHLPHASRNPKIAMSDDPVPGSKPTKPVIVTDVLDTLVRDPFYVDMASHFDFNSFQDFLLAKTPGMWVDFELGLIDEHQCAKNFFQDRAPIDLIAFKRYLLRSYQLLPGVDSMLTTLKEYDIQIHVCSNYPVWSDLIEQALGLRKRYGVNWTFVSAHHGIRKPDPAAFIKTAALAKVPVSSCILLDDRKANCDAAKEAGYMSAIHFSNTPDACHQLRILLQQCNIPIKFNI